MTFLRLKLHAFRMMGVLAICAVSMQCSRYRDYTGDTDGDGLRDYQELEYGTEIRVKDTDGDGLDDAYEVRFADSDPLVADTDGDGLIDSVEINVTRTSPRKADTDGDGLSDAIEYEIGTDPNKIDTDGDGLDDYIEHLLGSNSTLADSDGDGVSDFTEYGLGTKLTLVDTDGDGFADALEINLGSNPSLVDTDGDTINDNLDNCILTPNTSQLNSDTDSRGDACDLNSFGPEILASTTVFAADEGQAVLLPAQITDRDPSAAFTSVWSYQADIGGPSICVFTEAPDGTKQIHCDNDGRVFVTLTASDTEHPAAEKLFEINFANVAPVAAWNPVGGTEGDILILSLLNATDVAPDSAAGFTYAFDCGDGQLVDTGTLSQHGCLTSDNGIRAVRGRIRDIDGGERIYSSSLTVINRPPTAQMQGPTLVYEGQAVLVDILNVVDAGADMSAGFTYAFNCGSGFGSYSSVASASCPTTDNGTLVVKARVRDKDNAVADYELSFNVQTVGPTALFTAPATVTAYTGFTLSIANATDVSPADVAAGFTYAFDCGQGYGAFSSALTAPCTAQGGGNLSVRAKVRDKDGTETQYTETIVVEPNRFPENLQASTNNAAQVALSWDPALDALEYKVYRDGNLIQTLTHPTVTYIDAGASPPAAPYEPSGVDATDGTLAHGVRVTWTAAQTPPGQSHEYRVTAVNALSVESVPSPPVTGFRAALPLLGYDISRDGGVTWHVLGTDANLTTYLDTDAPLGTIQVGNAVASDATIVAHVALSLSAVPTATPASPVPYAVRAVNAAGVSTTSTPNVGHRGVSPTFAYEWQRSANGILYTTIPGDAASNTDADAALADGSIYSYRSVVSVAGATSATSGVDQGRRAVLPGVALTGATNVTSASFVANATLTNLGVVGADSYGFCMSEAPETPVFGTHPCLLLGTPSAIGAFSGTFFGRAGIAFNVRAFIRHPVLGIQYSATTESTTLPTAKPTGLFASTDTSEHVALHWDAVANAVSYKVFRDAVEIATVNAPTLSYEDTDADEPPLPDPPTNVQATKGTSSSGVTVSWTASATDNGSPHSYTVQAVNSTGVLSDASDISVGYRLAEEISSYEISLNGGTTWAINGIASSASVYTDLNAPYASLSALASVASDDVVAQVNLSLNPTSPTVNQAASPTYAVRARTAAGSSSASNTDTGYRSVGTLNYQWEYETAPSTFAPLIDLVTADAADTDAVLADGSPRVYRCKITAPGFSAPIYSAVATGRRAVSPVVTLQSATDVTDTTLTGHGTITNRGLALATDHGFCWATSPTIPTFNPSNCVSLGAPLATGAFSSPVTGLLSGTNYTILAFIRHPSLGVYYSVASNSVTTVSTAPVNFVASTNLPAHVHLSWDAVTLAASYRVYRDGAFLATVTPPDVTFDDITATGAPVPAAPTGLTATNGTTTTGIGLSWSAAAVSPGTSYSYTVRSVNAGNQESPPSTAASGNRAVLPVTSYQVSLDGTNFTVLNLPTTPLSYLDSTAPQATISVGAPSASDGANSLTVDLSLASATLTPAANRTYSVRAVNGAGEGAASSPATGVRQSGALSYQWEVASALPGPYTTLAGAVMSTASDGTAPADGASRYYQCVVSAPGAVTATSSIDSGFRFSSSIISTEAPTVVNITDFTANANLVTLGAPAASAHGFCRAATAAPTLVNGATCYHLGVPATVGTFTHSITGLTAGQTYYVAAYVTNGSVTVYGSDLQVTTTIGGPTLTSASTNNSAHVQLVWSAVSGATKYRLYRNGTQIDEVAGSPYTDTLADPPPVPPAPTAQASDGTLTTGVQVTWNLVTPSSGTQHSYTISAVNAANYETPQSPAVTGYRAALPVTSYEISRDGGVNFAITGLSNSTTTHTDTDAAFGSINGGAPIPSQASDGEFDTHVALTMTVSTPVVTNPAPSSYVVRAVSAAGNGTASSSDSGFRDAGAVSYQWQRSASGVPGSFTDITGVTTQTASDSEASIANGSAQYYQCRISAPGATTQYTQVTQGFRAVRPIVLVAAESAVTTTSFAANGSITNLGVASATEHGFCIAVSPAAAIYAPASCQTFANPTAVGATTANFTGLTPGVTYNIRAFITHPVLGIVYSSTTESATTLVQAPTTLTASINNAAHVTLNWSTVSNASKYNIYRDGIFVTAVISPALTHNDALSGDPPVSPAPTLTTSSSTSGTVLTWNTVTPANGASRVYTVKAVNDANVEGAVSPNATGYRLALPVTGYQFTRDGGAWSATLPTNASPYTDTASPMGTINAGTTETTDGTVVAHVSLSLSTPSTPVVSNPTPSSYVVRAVSAAGDGVASTSRTGFRSTGAASYQWQRSLANTDANYSNLAGLTNVTALDTDAAVADGSAHYYRIQVSAAGATTAYSVAKSGRRAVLPILATNAATLVATTSYTANGQVTNVGVPAATAYGFCYSLTSTPPPAEPDPCTTVGPSSSTTPFTLNRTGQTPDTMYYYRAFATHPTLGKVYSAATQSVRTLLDAAVVTLPPLRISSTTMAVQGSLTTVGNPTPTAHGLCVGTGLDPTLGEPGVQCVSLGAIATPTQSFTTLVSGLSASTLYRVRAYITQGGTTTYGTSLVANTCATGNQDNDADGVCATACGALVCPSDQLCDDSSGVALCSNPVPDGFNLVYDLTIDGAAGGGNDFTGTYTTNNAANPNFASFDRIGYLFELNNEWVWVQLNDFSASDTTKIGIPLSNTFDATLNNLSVRTNSTKVAPATNVSSGKIEFWPIDYTDGGDGKNDHDDLPSGSGYGSMQIHNGTNTLFAMNGWNATASSTAWDLGIGNNSGTNQDWKTAANAGGFTKKRLRVFAASSGASRATCNARYHNGTLNFGASCTATALNNCWATTTIDPDGAGSIAAITADCFLDPKESVAYTVMLRSGGTSTASYSAADSCKTSLGWNLAIPRSFTHAKGAWDKYGSGAFAIVPGVFGLGAGSSFASFAMNSTVVESARNWKALDGGRWFINKVGKAEPSGDYTVGGWLKGFQTAFDANGFNVSDLTTTPPSATTYPCSPNDVGRGSLAAPLNLQASEDANAPAHVALSWTPIEGAVQYKIRRDATVITINAPVGVTTPIGHALAPTHNDTGASPASVAAPTGVGATNGATNVTLNWTASAVTNGNVHSYTISFVNGKGEESAVSVADSGRRMITPGNYEVSINGGAFTTLTTATTWADTNAPAPIITAGTATASNATSTAHVALGLTGSSVANGATRTYVIRSQNSAVGVQAGSVSGFRAPGALTYQWERMTSGSFGALSGGTTASYLDTDAAIANGAVQDYRCQVSALGAVPQYSNQVTGRRAVLPAVTSSAATSVTTTSFVANGNVTNIGIVGATDHGFCRELSPTTPVYSAPSCTSLGAPSGVAAINATLSGLTAGKTYRFVAYIKHPNLPYEYSAVQTVTTRTLAPTTLSATTTFKDRVTLTWSGVTDATGYAIYRDGGFVTNVAVTPVNYSDIGAGAPPAPPAPVLNSATDGTLTTGVELNWSASQPVNGATHTYVVRALNASSLESANSPSASGSRALEPVTSYEVSRTNGSAWEVLNIPPQPTSVTYLDTGATLGTIGAMTASASDATVVAHVELRLTPAAAVVTNPSPAQYKVRAKSLAGTSLESGANAGHRTTGAAAYQWQVSTNGTTWTNISGTSASFDYGDASIVDGSSRHYKCLLTAAGAQNNESSSDQGRRAVLPIVTMNGVSTVTGTGFTPAATVTNLGVLSATGYGFCYTASSVSTDPRDPNCTQVGATSTTSQFSNPITGLSPGVAYSVRAYTTHPVLGKVYSTNVLSATTLLAPTVATRPPLRVGSTTMAMQGALITLGAPTPTDYGFCYGTTADPTVGGTCVSLGAPSGTTQSFSGLARALTVGTMYNVRAYATQSGTHYYGTNTTVTLCTAGNQDNDANGACLPNCSTAALSCPSDQLCDDSSGVAVCSSPVPDGFSLVYEMSGKGNAASGNDFDATYYSINNAAALAGVDFDRVGYLLELDSQWVWVQAADFSGEDYTKIGVPAANTFETSLTNLTVRTNSPNVAPVTNVASGLIEFWPVQYATGTDSFYDHDDSPQTGVYGSMQIHNGTQTLFAINRFRDTGTNSAWGYGIGNRETSHPDWTHADNANSYSFKRLRVYAANSALNTLSCNNRYHNGSLGFPVACHASSLGNCWALAEIDPDGGGAKPSLNADCFLDPRENVVYTAVKVTGGTGTIGIASNDSCKTTYGWNLAVPRSLIHATGITDKYGTNSYGIVPVFGLAAGAYGTVVMNSAVAQAARNWRAVDGGRWFLRNVVGDLPNPSGDYTPGHWLLGTNAGTFFDYAQGYEANDTTAGLSATTYPCSPNDVGRGSAASPFSFAASENPAVSAHVALTWAPVPGAASYEILRTTGGSTTVIPIAVPLDGSPLGNAASPVHNDTGAGAPTVAAPTGLTATNAVGQVNLSWTASVITPGTLHTYAIRAVYGSGAKTADSATDTGRRTAAITRYDFSVGGSAFADTGSDTTHVATTGESPSVAPGTVTATEGTNTAHVTLTLTGHGAANGTAENYIVRGVYDAGNTANSNTVSGQQLAGPVTIQWQRSPSTTNALHANISGATATPYNDTGAPANGDDRYYQAVVTSTGISTTATAKRGYRAVQPVIVADTAQSITPTSFTARANITNLGVAPTPEVGICISASNTNPTTSDTCSSIANPGAVGVFTRPFSGLTPNTLYYVRSYIKHASLPISYVSNTSVRTTTAVPTITSVVGSVAANTVNFTGGTGATRFRVYRGGTAIGTTTTSPYVDSDAPAGTVTAPDNVQASDGTNSSGINITWNAATAAPATPSSSYTVRSENQDNVQSADSNAMSGARLAPPITYRILRGATEVVASQTGLTYLDTGASSMTFTGSTASASDGTSTTQVDLVLTNFASTVPTHTYTVQTNALTTAQATNTGWKGTGPITYTWERASATTGPWAPIVGAESATRAADRTVSTNPNHFFRCTISAAGATTFSTAYDAGYRLAGAPVTSCADHLYANPAATNGTYTIDPDGAGPLASFSAYCDMTTDGGGWTIVHAATGVDGESAMVSNTAVNGNPLTSGAYNLQRAQKMALSAISTESIIVKRGTGAGQWLKVNRAFFDNYLDTANTHRDYNVAVTANNGVTDTNARMGYSNYDVQGGGDFGIVSTTFDHHVPAAGAKYLHLNYGCDNQYFGSYSAASADSDAGYDSFQALGSFTATASASPCSGAQGEGGALSFYAAMRGPPKIKHQLTFTANANDSVGNLTGSLLPAVNGATISNGGLNLDGVDDYVATGAIGSETRSKTLIAWTTLANLTQKGGGLFSIEDSTGLNFDSIVYGEQRANQWMPGSEGYTRTPVVAEANALHIGHLETSLARVMLAITYQTDSTITVYRNGQVYIPTYRKNVVGGSVAEPFNTTARLLVGCRHNNAGCAGGNVAGPGNDHNTAGVVHEARLYERDLSAAEIARIGESGPADEVDKTCADIRARMPDAPNGDYVLDVDGVGGAEPFVSYCDMTADGGGWTLAANLFTDLGASADFLTYLNRTSDPLAANYGIGLNTFGVNTTTNYRLQCESSVAVGTTRTMFLGGFYHANMFRGGGTVVSSEVKCSNTEDFATTFTDANCFDPRGNGGSGVGDNATNTYYGIAGNMSWSLYSSSGAAFALRHCDYNNLADTATSHEKGKLWFRPGRTGTNTISGLRHLFTFEDSTARDSVTQQFPQVAGTPSFDGAAFVASGDDTLRLPAIGQALSEKTLIAWYSHSVAVPVIPSILVYVAESDGAPWDGIAYGILGSASQWQAGSDNHSRTQNSGGTAETAVNTSVMIAIVYKTDNSITIYRNGVVYGTPYTKGTLASYPASAYLEIGAGFAGKIEEVRVYSRALSASELSTLYSAGQIPVP